MSEPESDRKDPDAESMFDFLAEEGAEKQRRKKRSEAATERPLPIIRKPVPVSQSGPLLPPKPGAPIPPPPELTSGSSANSAEDDLGFLDDMPARRPVPPKARKPRTPKTDSDSKVTRLDSRSKGARTEVDQTAVTRRVAKPARFKESDGFDDIQLGLDDSPEFGRGSRGARPVARLDDFDEEPSSGRGRWLALALVLIAAGAGSFAYTKSPELRALLTGFGLPDGSSSENGDVIGTDTIASSDENTLVPEPSGMMQQFQEQLSLVEGLIDNGNLDDAEQALSSMDRTVYGYGAMEFGALENRIGQLRSGVVEPVVDEPDADQIKAAEAARLAEERAAQAERERLVAAEQASRDAAERARVAEQARVEEQARAEQARAEQARAEQARAEQARAEQVASEEQARIASEQAQAEQARADQVASEEQARIASEQAQAEQAEAARIASAEQSARQEQASAAAAQVEQAAEAARQEAARLDQLRQEQQAAAQNARTSDWPATDRDRQATDRRIAEERAALQRQEAREQRLVEAREREAALAAQAESLGSTEADADIPPVVDAREEQTSKAIDDDELQIVYRRFIELQRAVSSRDINAVVGLTERSGVRVQQFMQIFENSTQIDARIRNVSTNNATGEIKGTLQINRIQRANGTFVEPPSALASIPLTSTREGDGWSAIVW